MDVFYAAAFLVGTLLTSTALLSCTAIAIADAVACV